MPFYRNSSVLVLVILVDVYPVAQGIHGDAGGMAEMIAILQSARMAVYELKFDEEKTDVGVVVNEAIELAKKYGTDDSSRFINGVLAGVNSKG